jgi:hypothetical protein
MRIGLASIAMYGALVVPWVSGCSRGTDWQKTYEGCRQLSSAMKQDSSGLLKAPDCERIPQFCSNDPNSSDCKSELANYSIK